MDHNPSAFRGPDRPVERVEWHDAQAFLDALNARTGLSLRLPTEAEWEYAARSGGKQERYAGGHALDEAAWHRGNAGGTTHPVGQKAPNGLGLHDMSGNVWEWCDDAERRYYTPAEKNPRGTGSGKVFRGGSHTNAPDFVRTTHRIYIQPDIAYDNLGFRVLRPE
jgi:formylglycine-generating enzyme required for sulfatase activity